MDVLTHTAGFLILAGFVSVAYTLITRQTTARRRPVYWLALFMSAGLVAIYIDFLGELLLAAQVFPEWTVRMAFVSVYVILGCLLILVPWIDRREYRELRDAADEAHEVMAGLPHEGD